MTSRKTISVAELVDQVNVRLAIKDSTYYMIDGDTPQQVARNAQTSLIEWVLMRTDNYKGFRFLPDQFDEPAHILKQDCDNTRRKYYGGT